MKEYIIIFKENTDVYMQLNSKIKEVIQIKINQIKFKKNIFMISNRWK